MLEQLPSFNREVAARLLAAPHTDALSALVACSAFLQDDLLDEDDQPYVEGELALMLDAQNIETAPETLTRVVGLLYLVSGPEMQTDVPHFRRAVAAVVEGSVFAYDDEIDPGGEDEPSLADVFWTLYLGGLLVEGDLTDELSPKVRSYIELLGDEEAVDVPALQAALDDPTSDIEELEQYTDALLVFRRRRLALNLRDLGCKPEWVAELDPDLARDFAQDLDQS